VLSRLGSRSILVALLFTLATTSSSATASGASGVAVITIGPDGEAPTKQRGIKGRMEADGPYIPGRKASVQIRQMPKGAQVFAVTVEALQASDRCEGAQLLCLPEFALPIKGRKTSAKGRARITFTMPDHFLAFRTSAKPKDDPEEFDFHNGQSIRLFVIAVKVDRHGQQVVGTANKKSSILIPPA
jgi:hypothetical protein